MTSLKKILILTADAGFGHRSAANAIAAALAEKYPDQSTVEIVNPLEDKRVPAFLRKSQSDYDRIIRETPELYKLGYDASDASVPSKIVEQALTLMLFEALRDTIRKNQPDAIVSTYPLYQAPLSAVFAVGKRDIPLLTVITDLATVHRLWFHEAVDLCLVPTTVVRDLAVMSGLNPDKVRITGIPVHPRLVTGNWNKASLRAELGLEAHRTTVLIVGSKRVRRLAEYLRGLDHSRLPLQLILVAGGDGELFEQFQKTDWHLPVRIYNFVDNMPSLLQAADCTISKAGGLIITEALACGLPLLLIDVLPGQEAGNAEFVVGGRAGELVKSPLELLETMYHWLDHGEELFIQYAQNAQRLGKPMAAFEIADLAWSAAERGPSARENRKLIDRESLVALLKRYGILPQSLRSRKTIS